jgi:hypothetical protein
LTYYLIIRFCPDFVFPNSSLASLVVDLFWYGGL